jgi:hypothetical protein
MPVIGFHNSHEEVHPAELLKAAQHAEEVGFAPPLCWDLDLGQHAAWIAEYLDPGFDGLYLHHVGPERRGFLDAYGERVLPQFDVVAPAPAVAVPA